MTLRIEKVENGFILVVEDELAENPFQRYVFENKDDGYDLELSELQNFEQLLWRINALVGPTTSRYSPNRIKIALEPGDKFDPKTQNN